jgi:hypothetical protein
MNRAVSVTTHGLMRIATDDNLLLSQIATEDNQSAVELLRERGLALGKK